MVFLYEAKRTYKRTRVRLFPFLVVKAYLANIPLKNKPTINKRLSATENHNHKNHMQQKWPKTTNQPTSLFFTTKMRGKSLKIASEIAIV